jgi:hypothetical protein
MGCQNVMSQRFSMRLTQWGVQQRMHKKVERSVTFGYDHTMGNTPDPIRTPKLSPIGPG